MRPVRIAAVRSRARDDLAQQQQDCSERAENRQQPGRPLSLSKHRKEPAEQPHQSRRMCCVGRLLFRRRQRFAHGHDGNAVVDLDRVAQRVACELGVKRPEEIVEAGPRPRQILRQTDRVDDEHQERGAAEAPPACQRPGFGAFHVFSTQRHDDTSYPDVRCVSTRGGLVPQPQRRRKPALYAPARSGP
jgi:hypothetical protein